MNEQDAGLNPEDLKQRAQETLSEVSAYGQHTWEGGVDYVRANPVPAVFGAFGLGLLIGLLLHRPEPTARERYLEGPMEELRSLLSVARRQVGNATEEGYGGASSAIQKALEKARRAFIH